MTECNQSDCGFSPCGARQIVSRFDGGTISSDGGALLLRETDKRLNLLPRLAQCFLDGRNQDRVEHTVLEMVSQRVYGLALGYEDINDHEELRKDPLFGILAGREETGRDLAGKSTLNRLEPGTGVSGRYKKITFWKDGIDELLVSVFLESKPEPPREIVLDIDTTDLPLHGEQEGPFFHGYYDSCCYLPLYIFCGDHVELMNWCETNEVDYLFGMAKNKRLRRIIDAQMWQATRQWNETKQPARVFTEFEYETRKSWARARRVVAKAEHIDGKENPRFVVTSLASEEWPGRKLYEEDYCGRGDMENRIKEQFSLFADRVSAETMRANQMRLYLSAMAYVLMSGLRRIGLKATELAGAQISTIRRKVLKIGARIRVTVRKVWVSMASGYPWQGLYGKVWANLRC